MSGRGGAAGFRSGRGGPRGGGPGSAAFKSRNPVQQQQQQQDEEAEEVIALREKYGEQLELVSPLFPDWSSEDILMALGEANGSAELAIARIAEGHATQFSSVGSKPKKSKAPNSSSSSFAPGAASDESVAALTHPPTRGGARGGFAGRGGRGGGEAFRGRGGFRGGFRGGVGRGRGGAFGAPPVNGHSAPAPSSSSSTAALPATAGWGASAPTTAIETTVVEGPDSTTTIVTETQEDGTQETVVIEESAVPASEGALKDAIAADILSSETASVLSAAKPKVSSRVIPAGSKMSWAQIARPPPPAVKTAPAPTIAAAPASALPADVVAAETLPEILAQAIAISDETEPLLASEDPVVAKDEQIVIPVVSNDPWASTPAAADPLGSSEPAPLPVGEGWADAIIAKDTIPINVDIETHQRAEEAAPPAGVDPAGPLDVHTPAPAQELQQAMFDQPSALAQDSSVSSGAEGAGSNKLAGPPGLSKRAISSRNFQDAAVVMPNAAAPDVDRVGVQFGSLNLFGSALSAPEEQQQQQQSEQSQFAPSAPAEQVLQPQQVLEQPSRGIYETPAVSAFGQSKQPEQQQQQQYQQQPIVQQEQQVQQQQRQPSQPQQQQQSSNHFGTYQQASSAPGLQQPANQQQQQQTSYGQDRFSGLQGYGSPAVSTQQSTQQNQTSAYANRYPQSHAPFPQSQQQQQHDSFSSLQTASSPYSHHLGGAGGATGAADSISPYFSNHQQAQQSQQASAPSPAPPASVRDSAAGNASTYGGFTSAINHNQGYGQSAQQSAYDYDSRNYGGFYNQYDQSALSRASGADDSSKLGSAGTPTSGQQGQAQQQQQPQSQAAQQHQQYASMMQHHYGYPPHNPYYPPYGGYNQGYPGYPYGGYPGYGPPGGVSQNRFQGGPGNSQIGQQGGYNAHLGGGFGGSLGSGASTGANQQQQRGGPYPTSYGSNAYGSLGNNQGSGAQAGQNVNALGGGAGGQEGRGSAATSKDFLSDPFLRGSY